jgi:branched-chain amino acid transport system ATP-binding protein
LSEPAANGTLLSCSDLHAYYGESYVLHGVSFEVRPGEIFALLGRNGAGKTSTLRTIARTAQPQLRRGQIVLKGQAVQKLRAFEVARRGLSLVPEDRRIIPGLTVEENLKLAQVEGESGWSLERIYERFPRLAERRRQQGVTLSGGEQQMLAIARALARKLSLLLLDEPYEGLAPRIVSEIQEVLVDLKAHGLTVLLVEQNAVAALRIADRCAILDDGSLVFTGEPKQVLASEDIRREYLAI